MPTRHQRIPVTNDPELSEALARVSTSFPGLPKARVVHDLAVRGAQAVASDEEERDAGIERLVALSTQDEGPIDWAVLERVDELAWGE